MFGLDLSTKFREILQYIQRRSLITRAFLLVESTYYLGLLALSQLRFYLRHTLLNGCLNKVSLSVIEMLSAKLITYRQ